MMQILAAYKEVKLTMDGAKIPERGLQWRLNQAKLLFDRELAFTLLPGVKNGVCACQSRERCSKPGKHPLGNKWQEHPIREWTLVEEHIGQGGNVGLLMGSCIGLDFDGPQGHATLRYLEGFYPELRNTFRQHTQGGGVHVLLRAPPAELGTIKNTVKVLPGLDIRFRGSQLVAAGSIGTKGVYSIEDPSAELIEFPPLLLKTLLVHPAFHDKLLRGFEGASEGQRNEALFRKLCAFVEKEDKPEVLKAILIGLNARCRPPLEDENELDGVVTSALNYGGSNPKGRGRSSKGGTKPEGVQKKKRSSLAVLSELVIGDGIYTNHFAYDSFKCESLLMVAIPHLPPGTSIPTRVEEDVLNAFRVHVQRTHGDDVNLDECFRLVDLAAKHRRFHPLVDWLQSLEWDGVHRLDLMLETFAGAESSIISREASRILCLSMVARVTSPGCKVDTVVILEGAQGLLKSTFLRALAGHERFDDSFMDPESKDCFLQLQGIWVKEFQELALYRGKSVDTLKAFFSSCLDRYRPPYGRKFVEVPRQCVFVATTNEERYLKDETGNRRFLPVRVTRKADIEGFVAVRDQIFAEAYARVKGGEAWHTIDASITTALVEESKQRVEVDPWEDVLEQELPELQRRAQDGLIAPIAIFKVLGIDFSRQDKASQTRLGRVMKNLGYSRNRSFKRGTRYVKTADALAPPLHTNHSFSGEGSG